MDRFSTAGPRRRPSADQLSEDTYVQERDDPGLADDVVDMIADSMESNTHQSVATNIPDAAKRDDDERAERQFLEALPRACREQLAGTGIIVTRAAPDGTGEGYIIHARDRLGRTFTAELSLDEGIQLGVEHGETMGRGIVDLICKRLLAARERWFARMM